MPNELATSLAPLSEMPCSCGASPAWDTQDGPRCHSCLVKGKKDHKYHARRTDGYPSALQAKRAAELKLLEKAGEIKNLAEEVPYHLEVNGHLICEYVADFVYDRRSGSSGGCHWWTLVVEDVKGVRTPVYRLKKKLMLVCLGIEIEEWP